MNKRDRELIRRVYDVINEVQGVRNPADQKGIVSFYYDISEVRVYLRHALRAMFDGNPDYAEDNRRLIEENLRGAEAFIARRREDDWGTPSKPYQFTHTC